MILVLQTNIAGRLLVWSVDRQTVHHLQRRTTWHSSELLLPLVQKLLTAHKYQLSDIERIIVVRGPGPFTAVRTGIIVANTLGWMLQKPVTGMTRESELTTQDLLALRPTRIKKFLAVRPSYGRAPNITKPKR